jgi:hypothetical protein
LSKAPLPIRWFLLVSLGMAACDTLYGFDSPRPSLGGRDTFQVDPTCADLPVDPMGLASVPTLITITGHRDSGLGAESVPVSVRVGPCDCTNGDCGVEGAGGQGGADGASSSGWPSCTNGLEPLSDLDASQFELTALDGRGCRQRSPSRLDCTLDASGEAAFGVVSRVQDAFNLSGYLPLCVVPLEVDPKREVDAKHMRSIAVLPRVGTSRVALAVVQVGEQEPPPPFASSAVCDDLLSCQDTRARARFQVGVVSADLPAASVRVGDFRPVTRAVAVQAQLRVLTPPLGGTAPFLSRSANCTPEATGDDVGAGGDAGVASEGLPLELSAGQSGSDVFYLCAPAYASEAEVTATLLDGSGDAPSVIPADVTATALTHAYSVEKIEADRVLFAEACGEQPKAVTPGVVQVSGSSSLEVSPDGQRILIQCPSSADNSTAGASGMAGSPADNTAPCSDINLTPGPQGSCTLKVPN